MKLNGKPLDKGDKLKCEKTIKTMPNSPNIESEEEVIFIDEETINEIAILEKEEDNTEIKVSFDVLKYRCEENDEISVK